MDNRYMEQITGSTQKNNNRSLYNENSFGDNSMAHDLF